MSIIVKGMEMPKSCLYCPMLNGSDECCLLSDEQNYAYDDIDQVKDNHCPLVELPQKHGRLIDADELIKNFRYEKEETRTAKAWIAIIRRAINHANTIVEKEV